MMTSSAKSKAPEHSWLLGRGMGVSLTPFFVVGIVNITPNSFYDGGVWQEADAAINHALALLDAGAAMLDLGGESTRPFADPVSADEECTRVLPVLQGILARRPDALVAVDTTKAIVAKACLDAGAVAINDISAFRTDAHLRACILESQPGYVLMHSQGNPQTMQVAPQYTNVVDEICLFFETELTRLLRAGLSEEHIVLDPGIGFGKTLEHNLEILKNIEQFQKFGRPVYMALSNKSLWKGLLGRDGRERNAPTLAATVALYTKGVRIHRVHEVREVVDALSVVHALQTEDLVY